MKRLSAVVAGYGMRGHIYSKLLKQLSEATDIVAVAEPVDIRRNLAKKICGISDNARR